MNVQSIRVSRDRELILSANQHLEQIYFEQENACIALSISRNYQILVENCVDIANKNQWKMKAKLWWDLYMKRKMCKDNRLQFNLIENDLHLD
jgi:hypothetical protein